MIHRRLINPFYEYECLWRRTVYGKNQLEALKIIDEYVYDIIEKRRCDLLREEIQQLDDDKVSNNKKKRPALLDILLRSEYDGQPLTNDHIRAEVNTFMFAGHETTGSTLSFVLYLLAKHPNVQEDVLNEINDSGILKYDGSLTIRALHSLKLMENVIKETLRLYPIFPMVVKKCVEDFQCGNIFIPANTFIGTTFSPNHLDDKYFKNAKEFKPERWNDEVTTIQRNPYVYQPFSAGLRNCIGKQK